MAIAAPQVQVCYFEQVVIVFVKHEDKGADHAGCANRRGADGGNRTHTSLRKADFKSAASASFATSACFGFLVRAPSSPPLASALEIIPSGDQARTGTGSGKRPSRCNPR